MIELGDELDYERFTEEESRERGWDEYVDWSPSEEVEVTERSLVMSEEAERVVVPPDEAKGALVPGIRTIPRGPRMWRKMERKRAKTYNVVKGRGRTRWTVPNVPSPVSDVVCSPVEWNGCSSRE
jgi:hypothetical protein